MTANTEDNRQEITQLWAECKTIGDRLTTLEHGHNFFEKDMLAQMKRSEESLAGIRGDLGDLPDRVSLKMTECKSDIEGRAEELFAKKSDVITPGTLRNILLLLTVAGTIVFSATNWVLNRVEFSDAHMTKYGVPNSYVEVPNSESDLKYFNGLKPK